MTTSDSNRLDEEEAAARAHVEHARRSGRTIFLGVELLVDVDALVPRPETELLAKTALEVLAGLPCAPDGSLTVIDMCCGSGNLACAIAKYEPRARVLAADLTDGCVALAKRNAEHTGLADRVHVLQGDLFGAFQSMPGGLASLGGAVSLIVCNPPYISTARLGKDRAALLDREPIEAFDGGPYGLSIHQRVINDAAALLRPDGRLIFEMGLGQERQLRILLQRSGIYGPPSFLPDSHGRPRIVVAGLAHSSLNS